MDKRISIALGLFGAAAAVALVRHPAGPPQPVVAVDSPEPAPARSARPAALTIYVAGAVRSPGVYTVPAGSRANTAVKAAGGLMPAADATGVNLAEVLEDGEEVLVPGADSPAPHRGHGRHRHGGHARHAHAKHRRVPKNDEAVAPVDLNHADERALASVPGIGGSIAPRIVAFRDLNGPFGELDDLLDVGGMSQSRLDRASKFLAIR